MESCFVTMSEIATQINKPAKQKELYVIGQKKLNELEIYFCIFYLAKVLTGFCDCKFDVLCMIMTVTLCWLADLPETFHLVARIWKCSGFLGHLISLF